MHFGVYFGVQRGLYTVGGGAGNRNPRGQRTKKNHEQLLSLPAKHAND